MVKGIVLRFNKLWTVHEIYVTRLTCTHVEGSQILSNSGYIVFLIVK